MSWSLLLALITNCAAVLVALYFLLTDFFRGSSSNNGLLFLLTLAMCGWIWLCYYLNSIGKTSLASILAWIPAFPLLGYGILILLFVILKPDMK